MRDTTAPRYRTDVDASCPRHELDGLTLLFHPPSGETHFLDSPVPEMLALLADAPCDGDTLAERLCARLGIACDEEARIVIATRLGELTGVGLVQAD